MHSGPSSTMLGGKTRCAMLLVVRRLVHLPCARRSGFRRLSSALRVLDLVDADDLTSIANRESPRAGPAEPAGPRRRPRAAGARCAPSPPSHSRSCALADMMTLPARRHDPRRGARRGRGHGARVRREERRVAGRTSPSVASLPPSRCCRSLLVCLLYSYALFPHLSLLRSCEREERRDLQRGRTARTKRALERRRRLVVLVRVAVCVPGFGSISISTQRIERAESARRKGDAHPRRPSAKPHSVGAACGSPILTPSAVTVAIWNCARARTAPVSCDDLERREDGSGPTRESAGASAPCSSSSRRGRTGRASRSRGSCAPRPPRASSRRRRRACRARHGGAAARGACRSRSRSRARCR